MREAGTKRQGPLSSCRAILNWVMLRHEFNVQRSTPTGMPPDDPVLNSRTTEVSEA